MTPNIGRKLCSLGIRERGKTNDQYVDQYAESIRVTPDIPIKDKM